jgi:uncharacterized membrane protein YfcA
LLESILGFVSGIVSGTGMGGGTILILSLTLFCGLNQHSAQATNLVFFVPTSISAILKNWKQKLINWNVGIITAIAGIVGAIVGAKISINSPMEILRKGFGIFLGIITILEIYSFFKQYKNNKKNK